MPEELDDRSPAIVTVGRGLIAVTVMVGLMIAAFVAIHPFFPLSGKGGAENAAFELAFTVLWGVLIFAFGVHQRWRGWTWCDFAVALLMAVGLSDVSRWHVYGVWYWTGYGRVPMHAGFSWRF